MNCKKLITHIFLSWKVNDITPFVEAIFDWDSFPVLHDWEARFYCQTSLICEKPSDMGKVVGYGKSDGNCN